MNGLKHELMWSYLSLERDSYTVAESSGQLKIKVIRKGYLGNTAYVGTYKPFLNYKFKFD